MTVGTGGLSPAAYAQELRYDLGLGWGRVEPKDVCRRLDMEYWEDDLGKSGSEAGALLQGRTGRLAVVVNQNIRYEARRRFTCAHELGHAQIPWHHRSEYWCTSEEVESYQPNRRIEREANEFAAEFLLPGRVIQQRLRCSAPELALVRELSDEYGTSLTATACKIVGAATQDPVAVALSDRSQVRWIVQSRAFRARVTARYGVQPVPSGSVAERIFAGGATPDCAQRVVPRAWLSGWKQESLTHLLEEVVPFPDLGMALSFLSLPEDDEAEFARDDEW